MQPPESNQLAAVNSRQTLQGTDMDIKELAPALAHRTCNRYKHGDEWPYQFTEQGVIDYATRLIAAYADGQEPVLVISDYKKAGRIARCTHTKYGETVSLPSGTKLFTAPPEPAPSEFSAEQRDKDWSAIKSTAPSSEEVREMVERLRSMDTYGYESQLAYAAADLLERLAAERDLWRETDLRDAARGDELAAEVKRLAALVPDGCVVVPREPTAAMILEGMCQALTVETYRAMIAAGEVK